MTDAKAVRFAAVLVVLAGYIIVFRTGESRIGARLAENAAFAARLEAGHRLVANGAALERERSQLRAALRGTNVGEGAGVPVSAFLRQASSVAAGHHTTVTIVTAGGASPRSFSADRAGAAPIATNVRLSNAARTTRANVRTPVNAMADADSTTRADTTTLAETASADTTTLETTVFDLAVEGRYADVLATVRALSASSRVLASVEIVALARKNAGAADPTLTASLRVTLHRLGTPVRTRSSQGSDDRARPV